MQLDEATTQMLVAFFTPLVVSLIKQTGWPTWVNSVIAIIVYVAFGLGAVVLQGQTFDLDNIVPAVTLFVTIGTVAYSAFWRNVGEQRLTLATSVRK